MTPLVDRLLSSVEMAYFGARRPFIVGIDGGAGAGDKSALAAQIAWGLETGVLYLDDFFTIRVAEPDLLRFPIETRWRHWFEWK